ncbi:MAG TPA: M56 family metallopeptidase [Rhizomicrobium sp.]|jgi:beta-lactamase regulating signal transducer with metallopeptidase domain|nr:M56 family metallopeptidase [Rhizomicrobium sp.]
MNAFFALRALFFAGEVVVGSLPVMALAFLAASQKRASARHLTFAGAFAALFLLPFLAALVPSPIRILLPADPQQIPAETLSDAATAAALPAPASAGVSLDPMTVALALAALWLLGVMFVGLRFAIGAWCLARLKQKSRMFALAPGDMPKIAAKHRECELRLAHDGTGPITWGIFAPVILLPKAATFWPRERLHAVLLHELAHIRRRDSLTQALSLAVCAFYWPNPLVWLGARALRREAEIAADDSVIVAGMKPSSYAGELLRLAEEFRAGKPALATLSLFMADRSALEARVESVLEPTSLRSGVTLMDVTKAAGLALVAAAAIAFACPSLAQDSVPPPPPAPPALAPPPVPPAPPVPPSLAVPPVPPVPAAPPAPSIARPALQRAMRLEAYKFWKLRHLDWHRLHADVARAQRQAHEAMARARPDIERAMAQVKESEITLKANEEAMRAVRDSQPEIEAALRSVGPEVERALAKAREDLKKAHIDMQIRESVDQALHRAQIKIDMRARDTASDSSAEDPPDTE